MKRILFVLLTVCCMNAFTQVAATTEDGRKVNLNSDGTWEYIDEDGSDTISSDKPGECKCLHKFTINKKDEFAGTAKIRLQASKIGTSNRGKKLDAYIAFAGNPESDMYSIYLNFYENLGCMSTNSYASFKFEDGSMVKLDHLGELDCASPMLFLTNFTDEIDKFRTLKVTTIRIQGTEYYSDITLEKPEYFMEAFNCCIFESYPEEE